MKGVVLQVKLKVNSYVSIAGNSYLIDSCVGFTIIGFGKSKKVKLLIDDISLDDKKSLKFVNILGYDSMELFLKKNLKVYEIGENGWVSHMYFMSFVPLKGLLSYL